MGKWFLCSTIMKIVLVFSFLFSAIASPFLRIDVVNIRQRDGTWILIEYVDMPANAMESVTLQCKVPLADTYEWGVDAKEGAPFAGSINVGDTTKYDIHKTWERTITHLEYPWDLLLVKCTAKHELKTLITFLWVVTKLKSSTHIPYHPSTCNYSISKCHPQMVNCFTGTGVTYRGIYNRTADGHTCQPWASNVPNPSITSPLYDAKGFHNYCRNIHNEKHKPWCITSQKQEKTERQRVLCNVPRCHDCMYFQGDALIPGRLNNPNWHHPLYEDGESRSTVGEDYDKQGQKIPLKCYQGKEDHWKKNVCKVNHNLQGRIPPEQNVPYCLAVTDKKKGEDESTFPNDMHWKRLNWIRCIAPQCLVRQVWFMFLNTDGQLHYQEVNNQYIEVPIYVGQPASLKYYHFGTTFCESMSLEAEEKLKTFLTFLQLTCNPTPQYGEIKISNPVKEMEGKYNLRYVFSEGSSLLESIEYKANFQLVVKTRSTLSLSPVYICPGYPVTTKLSVKGSFKIIFSSIEWLYSADDINWKAVESELSNFDVSPSGLSLTMNNIKKDIFIKVKGKSESGSMEVKQHVKVRAIPYLNVRSRSVEGQRGDEVVLQIECNTTAQTKWIFSGVIIERTEKDSVFSFSSVIVDSKKVESLTIKSLTKDKQGIYTIEVTEGGCRHQQAIYASIYT